VTDEVDGLSMYRELASPRTKPDDEKAKDSVHLVA